MPSLNFDYNFMGNLSPTPLKSSDLYSYKKRKQNLIQYIHPGVGDSGFTRDIQFLFCLGGRGSEKYTVSFHSTGND